jgi:hypothetical protein
MGLLLQLLLTQLSHLECTVMRRNVTTSLEARTLQELVEPLFQVRELREVYASPLCWIVSV